MYRVLQIVISQSIKKYARMKKTSLLSPKKRGRLGDNSNNRIQNTDGSDTEVFPSLKKEILLVVC